MGEIKWLYREQGRLSTAPLPDGRGSFWSLMRICLYTSTALPKLGGQEAVVDSLARHFTAMGHRAVVLAPYPRLPMRTRDTQLPYPVSRHPRFYSTRWLVRFYRHWLLRLLARENFDIVHCHDVYPTGYVASLCRPQMTAPLVITSHGGDVKAGNIRISKHGMKPRYQQAICSADALVSIGKFTEEGFRALVPDVPQLVTIPNGIDLEPYARPVPRPADLDPAVQPRNYFLFIGRLKRRKGVDLILDALARTAPATGVELVIAGTGEEQAALVAQVDRLALNARVRFVGRAEGALKIYLLQNAIATLMPSRVWEAFPLVLLESFASKRPVIGSKIPGIADLIEPGQTGTLVEPESIEALAEAMAHFRHRPDEADPLGRKAGRVAQGYSWASIARRHIDLYEELIAGRRGAGH